MRTVEISPVVDRNRRLPCQLSIFAASPPLADLAFDLSFENNGDRFHPTTLRDGKMCGRFTLRTSSEKLIEHFLAASVPVTWPEYRFRFNIAPSQLIAAIRWTDRLMPPELVKFSWGLIPSWSKEKKSAYNMINARAESITEKPSFRTPFRKSRCLIVADGFFEWQKMGDTKVPQYITRRDQGPFCFAGLWDRWTRGEDSLESATIITTTANELMSQFHDRMPVILQPRDYQRWLLGDAQDPDHQGLLELLKPDSPDAWQVRPVATRVNSVRNDDEACIAPVAPQGLF